MATNVATAEHALTLLMQTREEYRPVWPALMGDGGGTIIDPDNPDRVFVRIHGLQGSAALVFNKVAPTNRNDLPVLVGTTPEQPGLVQVLAVDWSALPEWGGVTGLLLHGPDHIVPTGPDPVYIQKRAIIPLRATPQDPPDMTLSVSSDYYAYRDGWHHFTGATTADLTSHRPAAGQVRWTVVYLDAATNALGYLDGTAVIVTGNPTIPTPPETCLPICAVKLAGDTIAITEAEIYDLRLIITGLGRTVSPAVHDLDEYHEGRLDTRHLWASVACCGAQ